MIIPQKDERDAIWEDILPGLLVYTQFLLKTKRWFRGNHTQSYVEGKEALDYVMEAIEKYLTCPEKHDPGKSSLSNYLKYNIIRSIIGNDCRSSENTTSTSTTSDSEDLAEGSFDSLIPSAKTYFDEQIDYDRVMSYVEKEIEGDKIVENVLLGIRCGLLRRDAIAEFKMSEREYDYAIRRLEPAFMKAAKQFNLKPAKS